MFVHESLGVAQRSRTLPADALDVTVGERLSRFVAEDAHTAVDEVAIGVAEFVVIVGLWSLADGLRF